MRIPALSILMLLTLVIEGVSQNLVHYVNDAGRYGYVDATGKEVIAPSYQNAFDFKEGLGCVQLNDKWGFINAQGVVVVPLTYDDAQWFSEGLAIVNRGATKGEFFWAYGGKYGFIDKTGKEVIPLKYDKASGFSEGLAVVNIGATRGKYGMEGGKYGYIDRQGKEVIPFIYDGAYSFKEGLAGVELNDKYGFIDRNGKEVIPFKYDRASNFVNGMACVKLDGKFGYIDRDQKPVIPFEYDDAEQFYGVDMAYVAKGGKYGFIDRFGNLVIPMQFDAAHTFRQGLASVKIGSKWGFINYRGEVIIAADYDYAGYFIDGKADVKKNGQSYQIRLNDPDIYVKPDMSPMAVIDLVRRGSVAEVLKYCERHGLKYKKETLNGHTSYTVKDEKAKGVTSILGSDKDMAVSFRFKDRAEWSTLTSGLTTTGYVPKEATRLSVKVTKDEVDITTMSGMEGWIISNASGPTMTAAQLDSVMALRNADMEKMQKSLSEMDASKKRADAALEELQKAFDERKKYLKMQEAIKP